MPSCITSVSRRTPREDSSISTVRLRPPGRRRLGQYAQSWRRGCSTVVNSAHHVAMEGKSYRPSQRTGAQPRRQMCQPDGQGRRADHESPQSRSQLILHVDEVRGTQFLEPPLGDIQGRRDHGRLNHFTVPVADRRSSRAGDEVRNVKFL
jgi:hypothetical protein